MSLLVLLHIIAGTIAISSGIAAPFAKKGGKAHKLLGLAFLTSILILGLSGAFVAWIRDIPLSFLNGLLISYFVVTSFNVIKLKPNSINVIDKCMAVVSTLLTVGFIYYALKASQVPSGELGGFGSPVFFAFGAVALVSAFGDIRFLIKKGLSGKQRLLRHLWRMFFPLFMSTAAFFLGQAKLFPETLQRIEILFAPVVFVIFIMFFWIVVIALGKHYTIRAQH